MLNSSVKPCPAYCQNRGQMTQNGRTANTSLAPAPRGNRRAAKHFAYATFTPAELEEVGALEDELRARPLPVDSPSVEPAVSTLAGAMWRRAKLQRLRRPDWYHPRPCRPDAPAGHVAKGGRAALAFIDPERRPLTPHRRVPSKTCCRCCFARKPTPTLASPIGRLLQACSEAHLRAAWPVAAGLEPSILLTERHVLTTAELVGTYER